QVPDLAEVGDVRLQADREPLERDSRAEEQDGAEVPESVLQQRTGRQDLRQLGAEAEVAASRTAPGRLPDGFNQRHPASGTAHPVAGCGVAAIPEGRRHRVRLSNPPSAGPGRGRTLDARGPA